LLANVVSMISFARCAHRWQVGGMAMPIGFDGAVACLCLAVIYRYLVPGAFLPRQLFRRTAHALLDASPFSTMAQRPQSGGGTRHRGYWAGHRLVLMLGLISGRW
jgi:hypothetical protein